METSGKGIIVKKGPHSVRDSLDRFEKLLAIKGIRIFARIDQQAEARKVDLDLAPTELLIFGNPLSGTAVMNTFPIAALDLPLKLLAWSTDDTGTWLAYNDPAWLRERYQLPDEMAKRLDFTPLVEQLLR